MLDWISETWERRDRIRSSTIFTERSELLSFWRTSFCVLFGSNFRAGTIYFDVKFFSPFFVVVMCNESLVFGDNYILLQINTDALECIFHPLQALTIESDQIVDWNVCILQSIIRFTIHQFPQFIDHRLFVSSTSPASIYISNH